MELTPRKRAVLRAIVKAYIDTGEPVGSKNLMALLENAPSSATIRNEMNDLCSMGLLHQPHTSAGRVPTRSGYKLYIDSLSPATELNDKSAGLIKAELSAVRSEPEKIPTVAAEVISKLTGLPAIACLITEKPARIKRVDLLPITKYSSMLLVVTDDGRTRNRIFRVDRDFYGEPEKCFFEIVEKSIKGREVPSLTKAYMQSVIAKAGLYALSLMPLLTAVFETAAEIESASVVLRGESSLYNMCSDEHSVREIMSLIKRRDPIISILDSIDNDAGVIFGADTGYGELDSDTVVAAKFTAGDKYKGYVGILGPTRMSYEQIIPFIKHTAVTLTDIMTKAQNDMED